MSSIKDISLAFFKGVAFGKGLIAGRELAENKDMAEDRWITIHPFGNMKQGEADTGEGKRYYQRIFINDETDEIEGGLGGKLNGTKIKDLGKKLKELRDKKGNGKGTENPDTTQKKTEENDNLSDLARKIKALTDGKEYTEEVANKVGDLMRQELEKNKEFTDLMDSLKAVTTFEEEWSKVTTKSIKSDPRYKAIDKQILELRKKYPDGYYMHEGGREEYFELIGKSARTYKEIYNELREGILNKIKPNMTKEEKDFITGETDNKLSVSKKMIGIFKNQFKDIIDFNTGNNIKAPKTQKTNISNGLAMYSQKFVQSLEDRSVSVKTLRKGSRAYHSASYRTVNVTLDGGYGTVAHEFAHAIESANPGIVKIEREFYDRRTKGEELRYLAEVERDKGYGWDEKTKTDNFVNPYLGKYYKGERNFELLSMGMTYLYERPNVLAKDKDYMNMVLGCLAYKG